MGLRIFPYRSGLKLSRIVYSAFGLLVATNIILVIADSMTITFLHHAASGMTVTAKEGRLLDSFRQNTSYVYYAALLLSVILFLVWVNRSNKNLDSFGVIKNYSSKFAVISFFIPLVNLVLFYQVMAEIWRGTYMHKSLLLIRFWWGCTIFSWILARFNKSRVSDTDIPSLIAAMNTDIVNRLSIIVCWTLAACVVCSITGGQITRNRELEAIRQSVAE